MYQLEEYISCSIEFQAYLALFPLMPAIAEPIASTEAKFDFPIKEVIFFIMGRRSDLPTVYAP